jgi:beta-galactosidase/beta-glucuronidase
MPFPIRPLLGLVVLFSTCLLTSATVPATQDLAGTWRFKLDPADLGLSAAWQSTRLPDSIRIPGTLTAQGYGDKVSMRSAWTGDLKAIWTQDPYYKQFQSDANFRIPFWLQPERLYTGAAWYQREIEIPAAWTGRPIRLFIERPHWETHLWIDDIDLGRCDRLGTPHEYDLGRQLTAGTHRLTLRIDNRMIVNVGPNSHSVSDHTQGNWNGMVGRVELRALSPVHVSDARVFATLADGRVRAEVSLDGVSAGKLQASLRYVGPLRIAEPEEKCDVAFKEGKALVEFNLGERARAWDEFTPNLYTLTLQPEGSDPYEVRFGFRDLGKDGAKLMINGHRLFLRGTLECAIFPIEGHPATDLESWRRIVRICKAHGLNHIRFHSWCPPEAAFIAADELGFYYQVEASSWANQGAEIGSGRRLDAWMEAESADIMRRNGNHPSFVLFCYGNEPHGPQHKTWLANFVAQWKARDSRHLYTTGAGWPVLVGSDYHSSPDPRIQHWGAGLTSDFNAKPPTTNYDWSDFVRQHPDAPTISHEIGQ